MVYNYMETLVDKALSEELRDNAYKYEDVCQCAACLASIKAAALNGLKPFYVTTLAGEVFGEYQSKELQRMSDVMVAVGKGVQAEKRPPGHG